MKLLGIVPIDLLFMSFCGFNVILDKMLISSFNSCLIQGCCIQPHCSHIKNISVITITLHCYCNGISCIIQNIWNKTITCSYCAIALIGPWCYVCVVLLECCECCYGLIQGHAMPCIQNVQGMNIEQVMKEYVWVVCAGEVDLISLLFE